MPGSAEEGIDIRVIDLYSVKPIDRETLYQAARETNGNLIVVEDHWIEGGLGSAVAAAFAGEGSLPLMMVPELRLVKLAVTEMPGSGTPEELLHWARIDADAIVQAVKALVGQREPVSAT